LFDPQNRRYRYPFISCTNCGPRFTIIKTVPYDRETTTMADFPLCTDCRREFDDPTDRRFHAQTNSCARCGPNVRLLDSAGRKILTEDPIRHLTRLLEQGAIAALKGLGGYHLTCNAFNNDAVNRLRARKHRDDKPLALMAPHADAVKELCFMNPAEESLLTGRPRPIVLLQMRGANSLADQISPGLRFLGMMLPYTPLHHLLLKAVNRVLVMTSGNLSEEPIAYRDAEALARLGHAADYFLVHDREIHLRCDDSVVRSVHGRELMIRRSRGYAPRPIPLATRFAQPVLACGAQLKNTFCLGKDRQAFISHHIGDLENYETFASYVEGIEEFQRLFDIVPAVVAHDLHPQYLSTKYALELAGVPRVGVQHHHAHIASCMTEHGLDHPVIGVAFDGLGYGADGALWGGEFLVATLAGYERRAHLRYVTLAGGDTAIRQPWRAALAYIMDALPADRNSFRLPVFEMIPQNHLAVVQSMIRQGVNTVPTSSCGRLFDAVAAIVGLRREVNYEGQAAVELEATALDGIEDEYRFDINEGRCWEIDLRPALRSIIHELQTGENAGSISAKFHNTLISLIIEVCLRLRAREALDRVCLSGGTFQNLYLLERVIPRLQDLGFQVFRNILVPANDGGISLGQAAVANEIMRLRG
jgi:hydrogenase maturation protein HypF